MLQEKLGVAISTYNRLPLLEKQIEAIRRLSRSAIELVVCDDGSSDATAATMRALGVRTITGRNRGIAWNKNRGIFYLMNHSDVTQLLLLDDDIVPNAVGWDLEWIEAIRTYGHVNHALPEMDGSSVGATEYSAVRPGLNTSLSGVAIGFTRHVIHEIGYMDTRFGKYGWEHIDLTHRALSRGFGGILAPEPHYISIRGGLTSMAAESHGRSEDKKANWRIYSAIQAEHCYRLPWRTANEYEELISEVRHSDVASRRFTPNAVSRYIEDNPGIPDNPAEAFAHWLNFGRLEGRSWPD